MSRARDNLKTFDENNKEVFAARKDLTAHIKNIKQEILGVMSQAGISTFRSKSKLDFSLKNTQTVKYNEEVMAQLFDTEAVSDYKKKAGETRSVIGVKKRKSNDQDQ